jgi:formamidopyrimidine-DNA glycosylase
VQNGRVPELPEVEALTTLLGEKAVGRAITAVEVVAISALKTFDPPPDALVGCEVLGVVRHGKFLDLSTTGPHLVTHLSRAGWVRWRDQLPPGRAKLGRGQLIALRIRFDDGSGIELTEAGTQKRLAVYIVADAGLVPGVARLGVDPLSEEFTPQLLTQLLGESGRQVKGVLTDQSVIAGVGNAYSDEALHDARLSPFKPAKSLDAAEVARLHEALVGRLRDAVERSRGLAASELKDDKRGGMKVHGRTGLPCPDCGETVRQVAFADRSLQYCPGCQTGGKVLADRRLSKLLK